MLLAGSTLAAHLGPLLAVPYAVLAAEAGPAEGQAAAALSLRLAPWRDAAQADLAWKLAHGGDSDAALAAQRRALAWAPADAYRWQEYAQLLGRARGPDAMTAPTLRAEALAPHSVARHRANALSALHYWPRAQDEALQEAWLRSMQALLQGRERQSFLHTVHRLGLVEPACLHLADRLSLSAWCRQAARDIARCSGAALAPQTRAWCQRQGILP